MATPYPRHPLFSWGSNLTPTHGPRFGSIAPAGIPAMSDVSVTKIF